VQTDKALVGAAGEYLVLSRLLTKGFLASPAPRGTEKVDIVVTDKDGKSNFRIQVKTTLGSSKNGWFLSRKHEKHVDHDLFFCLVSLSMPTSEIFVVPATVVAEAISRDHKAWLETPSRSGKPHVDSDMRRVSASMRLMDENWLEEYLERWDLLEVVGT
jgi:hypothetical protein